MDVLDFDSVERKGYGVVKILRGGKKIGNCRPVLFLFYLKNYFNNQKQISLAEAVLSELEEVPPAQVHLEETRLLADHLAARLDLGRALAVGLDLLEPVVVAARSRSAATLFPEPLAVVAQQDQVHPVPRETCTSLSTSWTTTDTKRLGVEMATNRAATLLSAKMQSSGPSSTSPTSSDSSRMSAGENWTPRHRCPRRIPSSTTNSSGSINRSECL